MNKLLNLEDKYIYIGINYEYYPTKTDLEGNFPKFRSRRWSVVLFLFSFLATVSYMPLFTKRMTEYYGNSNYVFSIAISVGFIFAAFIFVTIMIFQIH